MTNVEECDATDITNELILENKSFVSTNYEQSNQNNSVVNDAVVSSEMLSNDKRFKEFEEFILEFSPLLDEIHNLFDKYHIASLEKFVTLPIRNNKIEPLFVYEGFVSTNDLFSK